MKRYFTSILLCILLIATIHHVNAQAGTLDNSFSDNGYALFSLSGYNTSTGTGIELENDGKYLISGKVSSQVPDISKFLAIRVNTNGTIDSSFGVNGFAANNTFGRSFAHDLGLQTDGKVLLTGQDFDNVSVTENIGVMRLKTNGSLDTSFGDSGRVDIDHGHTEEGHTIIQLADGKIVLTGHTDYDLPSNTIDGPNKNNIFLARLNADGSSDNTFGTNGFTTFDFGQTQDYSKNMMLQNDKYIAGSCTCYNSKCHAAFIRVTNNGSLDTSFGTNGIASNLIGIESVFWRMAFQSDGKIIAVGQVIYTEPDYDLFVQRFFANGKIDSSFGVNGSFSLDLGEPAEKFEDVAVQSDGKIVCAGYTSEGTGNQSVGDAVVVRLNPNGTLDNSFSDDGIFVLSMVPGFDETKACLIDEQGRIVVAGYAHNTGLAGGSIFIFRLNSGCTSSYVISTSGPITFCKGQSVTLSVSPPSATYQWKKNGVAIAGATSLTYMAKASGSYTCTVSGPCGTFTTGSVNVTVFPSPKASIKPTGTVEICDGDSVLLKSNNTPGLIHQWFKGSIPIAGATASSYWVKAAGKYYVQTTDVNGCTGQSSKTTIHISCKSAVASSEEFSIYPNPSTDKIHLRLSNLSLKPATISVIDLTGKTLLTREVNPIGDEIDISTLSPGLYFLQYNTNGELRHHLFAVSR